MRRIIVCADDYALSLGVSRAIRELVSHGRLNAVSVMTVIPGFEQECAALLSTPGPISIAIGLHATLTGSFAPMAASPIATPDGKFPPLAKLLPPLGFLRIDRQAVKTEIKAQIAAFRKACGRAPDFVDGHQHVQLIPGVRVPFLEAVSEAAPKAWVRQCGAAPGASAHGGKARFLEFLSRGFRRRAEKLGITFNPAFSGAYDFSTAENFSALFARFLDGLPERGVVMCHPGFVDAELVARDSLTDRREAEYKFLAGKDFPAVLARAGATLA
jgi:predicted glycoside hydrolase/deacetylase ChbG (UPF0249 family)